MRDTVICSLEPGADREAIAASVARMVEEVAGYVPGYRLRVPPQFSGDRVTIYLEVEGGGDFLPRYAGNLDVMTAAAVRVAETIRAMRVRITDSCLRDGSHAVRHQLTVEQVRAVVAALDARRRARARGRPRRRARRKLVHLRLLAHARDAS